MSVSGAFVVSLATGASVDVTATVIDVFLPIYICQHSCLFLSPFLSWFIRL